MSAGRYATRNIEGFGAGLRELGYFESRHVTLALRFAECMPERMPALATYLFNVHRISTDRHDASFWLMIAKPPISFRAISDGSAVGCGIGCAAGSNPLLPMRRPARDQVVSGNRLARGEPVARADRWPSDHSVQTVTAALSRTDRR